MLTAELSAELRAAQLSVAHTDILGNDPAEAARAWAQERGMTDRRLRLLAIVLPAFLAGLVAAGAVLVWLLEAFQQSANGTSPQATPGPITILAVYFTGTVVSVITIAVVVGLILKTLHDTTARQTFRTLLLAVPLGGLAAAAAGIGVADHQGFATDTKTFVSVGLVVSVILMATISAGRWRAIHKIGQKSSCGL